MSAGQCLFGQAVFGFPILVAEVEDDENEQCRQAEHEDNGSHGNDSFGRFVAEVKAYPLQAAVTVMVVVRFVVAVVCCPEIG